MANSERCMFRSGAIFLIWLVKRNLGENSRCTAWHKMLLNESCNLTVFIILHTVLSFKVIFRLQLMSFVSYQTIVYASDDVLYKNVLWYFWSQFCLNWLIRVGLFSRNFIGGSSSNLKSFVISVMGSLLCEAHSDTGIVSNIWHDFCTFDTLADTRKTPPYTFWQDRA